VSVSKLTITQAVSVLGVVVVIALGAKYVLIVFIPLGFIYRLVMR
jgi:hypothetical protein